METEYRAELMSELRNCHRATLPVLLAALLATATEIIDADQLDVEASGSASETQTLTCSCCHLVLGANAAFTELCARCSWPLQLEWSDEAAYELEYYGWGGSCIACDNVQWPGTGCVSCGAPVEPDDGAYSYHFGWHDAAELAGAPAAALLGSPVVGGGDSVAAVDLATVGPLPPSLEERASPTASTRSADDEA